MANVSLGGRIVSLIARRFPIILRPTVILKAATAPNINAIACDIDFSCGFYRMAKRAGDRDFLLVHPQQIANQHCRAADLLNDAASSRAAILSYIELQQAIGISFSHRDVLSTTTGPSPRQNGKSSISRIAIK